MSGMSCTRARLVKTEQTRESRLLKVSAAGLLLGGVLLGASIIDVNPSSTFGDCGCHFDSQAEAATFVPADPRSAYSESPAPASSLSLADAARALAAEPASPALAQARTADYETASAAAPGAPLVAAAQAASAPDGSPLPVAGAELQGAAVGESAQSSGLSSMRPFDSGTQWRTAQYAAPAAAEAAQAAQPAEAAAAAAAAPAQAQSEVMDAPELARQPEQELIPLASRR